MPCLPPMNVLLLTWLGDLTTIHGVASTDLEMTCMVWATIRHSHIISRLIFGVPKMSQIMKYNNYSNRVPRMVRSPSISTSAGKQAPMFRIASTGTGTSGHLSPHMTWLHHHQISGMLNTLYCATTALDRYPLHSDKTHYIWLVTFLYICSIAFYKSQQSPLMSSSSLPLVFYFQLIFASVRAEPPMGHFISSFTLASSIMSAHQRPQPNPVVPVISETKWKVRQWRF